MGAFSYHRFIFLLACTDRGEIYIRLVFACTVKTAIEVKWLCISTSKKRHSLRAFSFLTIFLVCVRTAINRVNLALRTTIIEDTHLALAVIPFKVEANNSLFFCHYKHTRKNLPSFRSCSVYNSSLLYNSDTTPK